MHAHDPLCVLGLLASTVVHFSTLQIDCTPVIMDTKKCPSSGIAALGPLGTATSIEEAGRQNI